MPAQSCEGSYSSTASFSYQKQEAYFPSCQMANYNSALGRERETVQTHTHHTVSPRNTLCKNWGAPKLRIIQVYVILVPPSPRFYSLHLGLTIYRGTTGILSGQDAGSMLPSVFLVVLLSNQVSLVTCKQYIRLQGPSYLWVWS